MNSKLSLECVRLSGSPTWHRLDESFLKLVISHADEALLLTPYDEDYPASLSFETNEDFLREQGIKSEDEFARLSKRERSDLLILGYIYDELNTLDVSKWNDGFTERSRPLIAKFLPESHWLFIKALNDFNEKDARVERAIAMAYAANSEIYKRYVRHRKVEGAENDNWVKQLIRKTREDLSPEGLQAWAITWAGLSLDPTDHRSGKFESRYREEYVIARQERLYYIRALAANQNFLLQHLKPVENN